MSDYRADLLGELPVRRRRCRMCRQEWEFLYDPDEPYYTACPGCREKWLREQAESAAMGIEGRDL